MASADTATVAEAPTAPEEAEATTTDVAAVATSEPFEAGAADVVEAAGAAEMPPVADEPKPILIWRPARFEQRPRHRHDARAATERVRPKRASPGPAARRGAPRPQREGEAGQRPSGKQRFERKFGGKPGGSRDGEQQDGKDARPPARRGPNGGRTAARRASAAVADAQVVDHPEAA